MAFTHPYLAEEFHPTLNGDLCPDFISAGTNLRLWWLCKTCGHEWRAYGHTRKKPERPGCPACAGGVPTAKNNFAVVHPDLAKEFHPTLNGGKSPCDFTPGSGEKVWWVCGKCSHVWETKFQSRHQGKGCPACANVVLGDLSQYPLLLNELHPDESRDDNFPNSRVCRWVCSRCEHVWVARVGNRRHGTGCPSCAGQVVTARNCLAATRPDVARELHLTKNGSLTPFDVTFASNKRVWWRCSKCLNEWQTNVCSRTTGNSQCRTCAPSGFSQGLPGVFYVLCGLEWGKIGISNTTSLKARLAHHRQKGLFGPMICRFDFAHGGDALSVETRVKRFLRERFVRPDVVEGFSEAFPAGHLFRVLERVVCEVSKLG